QEHTLVLFDQVICNPLVERACFMPSNLIRPRYSFYPVGVASQLVTDIRGEPCFQPRIETWRLAPVALGTPRLEPSRHNQRPGHDRWTTIDCQFPIVVLIEPDMRLPFLHRAGPQGGTTPQQIIGKLSPRQVMLRTRDAIEISRDAQLGALILHHINHLWCPHQHGRGAFIPAVSPDSRMRIKSDP